MRREWKGREGISKDGEGIGGNRKEKQGTKKEESPCPPCSSLLSLFSLLLPIFPTLPFYSLISL